MMLRLPITTHINIARPSNCLKHWYSAIAAKPELKIYITIMPIVITGKKIIPRQVTTLSNLLRPIHQASGPKNVTS